MIFYFLMFFIDSTNACFLAISWNYQRDRERERQAELLLENVLTHIAGFFKVTQMYGMLHVA